MTAAFPKPAKPPKAKPVPLKRSWIKRKRPRRLDGPGSDPTRLAFAREQPCAARRAKPLDGRPVDPCHGRMEACHEGKKPGVAMKCPDSESLGMCAWHHACWTRHGGVFRGWSKEQRREWVDPIIAETHAKFLSHGNRRAA